MGFYILGEEEIVTGFGFAGVKGAVVYTRAEALEAFDKAVHLPDVHVLILTEAVASLISDRVMQWQITGTYPLLMEIPGLEGHLANRKSLVQSIREAIGISV